LTEEESDARRKMTEERNCQKKETDRRRKLTEDGN
jgi:hypothetical protein